MKHIVLILFITGFVSAQKDIQTFVIDGETYEYTKPSFTDFITKGVGDFKRFGQQMFNQEYTNANIAIVASTALFLHYDQVIYDDISAFGRRIGIGNGDNTKTLLSIDGFPIFRGPTDAGSAMYFIGDGWLHIGLGVSFYVAGSMNDDYRALQTASQLFQGMFTVGFSTQFLKHITGHETPNRASIPRGRWRWFPNQTDYHNNVPKYDAYPSGHVATATMTLTVISQNYAEYKWIKPVGWGLITLLGFQMINNGVHWASDYPLAVGMGYLFGKIAVESGRKKISSNEEQTKLSFMPYYNAYSSKMFGLSMTYSF